MNVLCTLALDKHFVAVAVAVCCEPLSETENWRSATCACFASGKKSLEFEPLQCQCKKFNLYGMPTHLCTFYYNIVSTPYPWPHLSLSAINLCGEICGSPG